MTDNVRCVSCGCDCDAGLNNCPQCGYQLMTDDDREEDEP